MLIKFSRCPNCKFLPEDQSDCPSQNVMKNKSKYNATSIPVRCNAVGLYFIKNIRILFTTSVC